MLAPYVAADAELDAYFSIRLPDGETHARQRSLAQVYRGTCLIHRSRGARSALERLACELEVVAALQSPGLVGFSGVALVDAKGAAVLYPEAARSHLVKKTAALVASEFAVAPGPQVLVDPGTLEVVVPPARISRDALRPAPVDDSDAADLAQLTPPGRYPIRAVVQAGGRSGPPDRPLVLRRMVRRLSSPTAASADVTLAVALALAGKFVHLDSPNIGDALGRTLGGQRP